MRPPAQAGTGGTSPAAALEEYRTAVRDTTRLNRLFAILGEPAPIPVVVDRVLLALSELFAADVVALLQVGDGPALHQLGAIGLPEEVPARHFSGAEGGHASAAARSRAPVLVPAARGDPALDPRLAELEVESVAWLPLLGSGAAVGLLLLARCQPLPFERSDVDLLMAMAHRIGLVLERVRAEEARQQLETRLRQADKAESLGRMAGAIAHHFNNKLSAVIEGLDLAKRDLPRGHPAQRELAFAQEAARQAASVSSLMLTYLGQGEAAREPLDLAATCREALPGMIGAPSERVRVQVDWPGAPVPVLAHAAGLRQVLGNLVANALEALPEAGGAIQVTLRVLPAAEVVSSPLVSPDWTPSAARYACLEVADTGCGIERSAVSKVFDPFYTTKFPGRGLGLPVVLGVVRAHEGTLQVESAPSLGSTFRAFLPLVDGPPLPGPARELAAPGRPGRAMVVDDEPLIRRASARLLAELGFEVITASDGVEALERFRQRPDELQLVVLDVTMPRLGGWETLSALRALRPGLPVVLASGWDEARVMSGEHPERPQAFLQKPFDLPQLEAAVRRALGR